MVGAWLGIASPATAHGVLIRSDPAPNTSVSAPPRQVILWFSEPVDSGLSSVAVVDRTGKRSSGRAAVSRDGRQITVALDDLGQGLYTVKWRVLSTVDGHTTSGAFAFAVGEAAPVGKESPGGGGPSPILVLVRWVGFALAVVLAGAAVFPLVILGPVLSRVDQATASRVQEWSADRLRSLTVISGLGLLVAVGVEFMLRASELFDVSVSGIVSSGAIWTLLGGTKAGWSALLRAAMAAMLLIPTSPGGRILRAAGVLWVLLLGGLVAMLGGPSTVVGSPHFLPILLVASVYGLAGVMMALIVPLIPDVRVPDLGWASVLAAAGLLAGWTVGAHAVGRGAIAAIADWLHVGAVSIWIGGLVCLLLVLGRVSPRDRGRIAGVLVSRFSSAAGISLGVVILTGLYASMLHLPGFQAFITSPYGRALLLKLLLVAPLLALGAFNRFVARPRLAAQGSHQPALIRRFLQVVSAEVTVGLAILLVVAALTITPPPREAQPAAAQRPLIFAGLAGDIRVDLTISPAVPGWNRLEAVITAPGGQPVADDGRVLLRLTKLDEDLTPATLSALHQGRGRYAVEGGDLGLPGWWEVQVIVRVRGRQDVATVFPLRLGDLPVTRSEAGAAEILASAEAAMASLRTWREVEQITDGAGGVVVTRYEFQKPDRLRLQTSSGGEMIVVGTAQYHRSDRGPWERRLLAGPIPIEGAASYLRVPDARGVRRGRTAPCAGEACQVVLWETPDRTTAFAGWIGVESRRLHRIMMLAPAHYMSLRLADFNAPVQIVPPQ